MCTFNKPQGEAKYHFSHSTGEARYAICGKHGRSAIASPVLYSRYIKQTPQYAIIGYLRLIQGRPLKVMPQVTRVNIATVCHKQFQLNL